MKVKMTEYVSHFETLGDRMKSYELAQRSYLDPELPFIVRLDGKAFHSYTKGLNRPYDETMIIAMKQTMLDLIEFANAQYGYTQSDEITLAFFKLNPSQQLIFNGQVQKIVSVFAARASVTFNYWMQKLNAAHVDSKGLAVFDARCHSLPNLSEVSDNFHWRYMDCRKNAITMAASSYFSHTELHKVNSLQKIELLKSINVNFNDYPEEFRKGTWARKFSVLGYAEQGDGSYLNVRRNIANAFNTPPHFKEMFDDVFLAYRLNIEYKKSVKNEENRSE